jgi:hypothetical protein
LFGDRLLVDIYSMTWRLTDLVNSIGLVRGIDEE